MTDELTWLYWVKHADLLNRLEESDKEILKSSPPEWSWRHPIRSIIINQFWMDATISAIERDEVRAYILLLKTRPSENRQE